MKFRHILIFLMTSIVTVFVLACAPAAAPATTAPQPTVAAQATVPPAPQATTAPSSSATFQEPCTPDKATKPIPADKLRLVIGTGGTGGVFFPYGGGIARILTEKMGNTEVTAEVTGGSVDNMKLIHSSDADLGMSTIDSAYNATQGVGAYQDTGKISACTIATLYTSFFHVVALDDSGINTIADMKGKRISVGSAGSSTEGLADRALEAAGLNPKTDITRDNLSVAESVSAIKDRKIDAFFWIGGLPTAAVTDLASTSGLKVKFLDTTSILEPLRSKYGPVYTPFVIPAGTYPGFDTEMQGIGIGNILFVNADMSEELVQRILTTLFDNTEEVRKLHPEAEKFSLESAAIGSSIPYHPGAIKFYQAQGVWK
jgi:uncharacterized protein